MDSALALKVRTWYMVLLIELLRIEPVPPFSFAVCLRELSVVWNTGELTMLVSALRHFIPTPRVRGVHADSEMQSEFPRGFGPAFDEVLLRPHRGRVPRLILAV